jgi:glutaredoxin
MSENEGQKKSKFPLYITIFAVIIAFIAGLFVSPNLTGRFIALTASEAGQKVVNYINQNVPGISCSLINSTEKSGVFEIWISLNSQQGSMAMPLWLTKDGTLLFTSSINISNQIQTQNQTFDAPDSERPQVELFVMSFCPYGVQAENLMKSVVDLLGTKADFKVRFIASVTGNTTDSVQSLHGSNEAKEDLRQVCIQKYYPDKFWTYLIGLNSNCYSLYRDAQALDTCWKAQAQAAGIDTAKIEACAYGSEGLDLLRADEQAADQYGVTASPTLIINGKIYTGARSSESFKQAVCSGFSDQPEECGQTLSSSASAPSGGC